MITAKEGSMQRAGEDEHDQQDQNDRNDEPARPGVHDWRR